MSADPFHSFPTSCPLSHGRTSGFTIPVKSLAKDGLVSGSGVRAGWDVNLQMLGISWHPELFRKGFSWIFTFYDFLLLFSV